MEVIELQPELDYEKVGQRIKAARMEKNLNQADLGALVGCSNNHISHVEIGQTKVSLPLLLKIATSLDINTELAEKLNQCNTTTLITISKIIDALIEQQNIQNSEQQEY